MSNDFAAVHEAPAFHDSSTHRLFVPPLLFIPESTRTWIPSIDATDAGMPRLKSQKRWRSLPAFAQLVLLLVPVLASIAKAASSAQALPGLTSYPLPSPPVSAALEAAVHDLSPVVVCPIVTDASLLLTLRQFWK